MSSLANRGHAVGLPGETRSRITAFRMRSSLRMAATSTIFRGLPRVLTKSSQGHDHETVGTAVDSQHQDVRQVVQFGLVDPRIPGVSRVSTGDGGIGPSMRGLRRLDPEPAIVASDQPGRSAQFRCHRPAPVIRHVRPSHQCQEGLRVLPRGPARWRSGGGVPTDLASSVLDPDPLEENQDVGIGAIVPFQAAGDGWGIPAGDIESGWQFRESNGIVFLLHHVVLSPVGQVRCHECLE